MNIDLIDVFGSQINATFFNQAVDQFEHIIQEGRVYLFSNGVVKMANRKFTSIKNDFCINFDKGAEIIQVNDDESIRTLAYNFLTINDLLKIQG